MAQLFPIPSIPVTTTKLSDCLGEIRSNADDISRVMSVREQVVLGVWLVSELGMGPGRDVLDLDGAHGRRLIS